MLSTTPILQFCPQIVGAVPNPCGVGIRSRKARHIGWPHRGSLSLLIYQPLEELSRVNLESYSCFRRHLIGSKICDGTGTWVLCLFHWYSLLWLSLPHPIPRYKQKQISLKRVSDGKLNVHFLLYSQELAHSGIRWCLLDWRMIFLETLMTVLTFCFFDRSWIRLPFRSSLSILNLTSPACLLALLSP